MGYVGVIYLSFDAERGGGRGIGGGDIYCVVVIVLIVYVTLIEGWTSVVEGNGFVVQ